MRSPKPPAAVLALTITMAGGPVLVHVERATFAGPTVQQLELHLDHQPHEAKRLTAPGEWILREQHFVRFAIDALIVTDSADAVIAATGSDRRASHLQGRWQGRSATPMP
jgi:hypothetical protein